MKSGSLYTDIKSQLVENLFAHSNAKGFKMALLNIVSLTKHIDQIRILLSAHPFDLLALNETKLDPTITSEEMRISNYELIRQDRNRHGGGVGFYLRSSIKYRNRSDLVPQGLEAVCIEITLTGSKPFVVITIYRPPNSSADYFIKIEQLIRIIDSEEK